MNVDDNRKNIRSVILLYQEALACLEVAAKYLQNTSGYLHNPTHGLTTSHQARHNHSLPPHHFEELKASTTLDQLSIPHPGYSNDLNTGLPPEEQAVYLTGTRRAHSDIKTSWNIDPKATTATIPPRACRQSADFNLEVTQNLGYEDAHSRNAHNHGYATKSSGCNQERASSQTNVIEVFAESDLMEEASGGYENLPLESRWGNDPGLERAMHPYSTEHLKGTEFETQQDVDHEQSDGDTAGYHMNQAAGVWCSSSPPSSNRSSSANSGNVQDQAVDQAVVEGLLDRCGKIIASVQAQIRSDNPVIKESLVSLLRSLELQQRLLAKKKRSLAHSESQSQSQRFLSTGTPATATTPAVQRIPNTAPDSLNTVPHLRSDVPSSGDDGAAAAAVGTMRSVPSSHEGLGAVVGMEDVKQVLQEAFVWPLQFPQLFTGQSLETWSRLLLYGPPGTGKTRLARALAEELRCPLYTVAPSAVLSSWLGSSEKIIRELFRRARSETGPVVVFLDEMDALCRTRSQAEDDCTRRIKTELLLHMDSNYKNTESYNASHVFLMSEDSRDGVTRTPVQFGDMETEYGDIDETGSTTNQMFIVAATNCPWDVDPAFLRRFQKRCYVALPDSTERRALLQAALSGRRVDIDTPSWDDVLAATEGFSGADLATVATAAAFRPIRELHSSRYWQFAEGNMIMPCSSDTLGAMQFTLDKLPRHRVTVRPIQAQDLVAAANTTARSVPTDLLQRYQHFAAL